MAFAKKKVCGLAQSVNQEIFKVAYATSCYHKDHAEKQLIYKTRPGYESPNRCSFSRFLKVSRDGAEVTSTGRSLCERRRQGRRDVQQ